MISGYFFGCGLFTLERIGACAIYMNKDIKGIEKSVYIG